MIADGPAPGLDPGLWTLVVLALLFGASFFFSGSESALFSLRSAERTALARGDRTGRQVLWLLERKRSLIATLLIGNVGANVALAATAAALLLAAAPDHPWLPVVVLVPTLVLAGEVTPKILAFRYNLTWSWLAAWPLTAIYGLVSPVRAIFSRVVSVLARVFGADADRMMEGLAEEELRVLLDHGAASGALDPMERDIIEAVFDFDDLTVDRLMTPRPDMFALPLQTPWDELLERCRGTALSRIPIYDERPDEVIGVLLLKDLLKHRRAPLAGPRQLRSLLLPPVFVPALKSADAMLREFLKKKLHMAFVVDEHGTLLGLITLDDLLHELVGEMEDTEEPDIARITPESLTVKASIDVDDFEEETGIALPSGDYRTLGGFVFHRLGRLPRQGDAVPFEGHTFTVTAMDGRRIAEVAVHSEPGNPEGREATA